MSPERVSVEEPYLISLNSCDIDETLFFFFSSFSFCQCVPVNIMAFIYLLTLIL